MPNVIIFSKNDECYTPKEVIDMFGPFDYDAATTEKKAQEFGISNYDTKETDGLSSDWSIYQRIWINPPFTMKAKFLEKAVETFKKTKNEIFILFPCDFITTKKFHDIMEGVGGVLYVPRGRINFESPVHNRRSPAFGSVILKLENIKDIVIKRIVI